MKMKILLFLTTLVMLSCIDNNRDVVDYFLKFQPRKCNSIGVISKQSVGATYNNVVYFDYYNIEANTSLKNSDYILALYTSNGRGEKDLDSPIPALEKEIELSFKKRSNNMKVKSANMNDTGYYTTLHEINYRIDGIRYLNISSLDAPLFGKPTGTSLNQYFEIFKYDPDFIASYDGKRLVYGYTDKEKPTAIDEWLSLSPMAQPSMFLRLNATPENLPITLRFKVDMETTDGIIISDTTKVVTLTN